MNKIKGNVEFLCRSCGEVYAKWSGKCINCQSWNTIEEVKIISDKIGKTKQEISNLFEVKSISEHKRILTDFLEFDRVLGGGFINSQVVLIAGEPGIGKSTLLLQTFYNLSKHLKCLYISGEESLTQVASRADRLFEKKDIVLDFLNTNNLQEIISHLSKYKPDFVLIDSIQTIQDDSLKSLAGSLAQIKLCAMNLTNFCKSEGIVLILIGHINKDGEIGGPKILEHLVDTVLQFEGEREGDFRILRSLKNRFGSTGEIGIFLMKKNGLSDFNILNNTFITTETHTEKDIGIVRTIVNEGNRAVILEIQALVVNTIFPYPKRVADGIPLSKIQLISAIIESSGLCDLSNRDIYVRLSGGYKIGNQTLVELAIAVAIYSALTKKKVDFENYFVGELSLNGNVIIKEKYHKFIEEVIRLSPASKIYTGKNKIERQNLKQIINIKEISKLLT